MWFLYECFGAPFVFVMFPLIDWLFIYLFIILWLIDFLFIYLLFYDWLTFYLFIYYFIYFFIYSFITIIILFILFFFIFFFFKFIYFPKNPFYGRSMPFGPGLDSRNVLKHFFFQLQLPLGRWCFINTIFYRLTLVYCKLLSDFRA